MVTLAQAIARRGGPWVVWLRIEGVGGVDGGGAPKQFTFTAGKVPGYAASDPTWLPYLQGLPKTLTERVNPLGGVRDVGQFDFTLIDRGNALTSLFRHDAPFLTRLTADLTRSATTAHATMSGRTLFELAAYVGAMIWIGQEAMQIVTLDASHLALTRGVLGTTAAPHYSGDPVRSYTPRLEGRTVVLGIVPYDATDATAELELDRFSVEQVGPSVDWTGFQFKAASRLMALARTVGSAAAGHYEIVQILKQQTIQMRAVLQPGSALAGVWPSPSGTGWEDRYLRLDGKEVITANANATPGAYTPKGGSLAGVQITSRARLGTSPVKLDDASATSRWKVTTPLVADTSDAIGSFRYSPGPSPATTRAVGTTWVQSDHWVDIILCLWLSAATSDDGLELVNYPSGGPNHSSLEVGWGAGIPVARVDVTAALAIKDRTPDWRFPAFMLEQATNLADLLNKQFLQPLGAFVVGRAGKLTIVLPRLSYAGQTVPTLDRTNTLRELVAAGMAAPRMQASYEPANQARAVLLTMTAPNGDQATRLITATQYGGQVTQYDAAPDKNAVLKMDVPGIRADQAGADVLVQQIAIRRLFRLINPPRLIEAWGDLGTYTIGLGDTINVVADLLPNPVTGTRGMTTLGTVIERAVNLDVGSEDPGLLFKALDYGPVAGVGRVAPAAAISAWTPDPVLAHRGSVTIGANVYTDPAASSPLPSTDAAAFAVGMRVKLLNPDGTLASPSSGAGQYVGISSITTTISGGNQTIYVDGDWGGMSGGAIAGKILVLADYDQARAQEQAVYTAEADLTYLTVGASQRTPWLWGEQ